MICKHTFVRINDATKPRESAASWNGMIDGATVGCVNCGQVRRVFSDGTLEVLVEGKKPIDEDHEHS